MQMINKHYYAFFAIVVTLLLPLLLWALGDFPRRALLKESLSLLFILSFVQLLGLLILNRNNSHTTAAMKPRTMVRWHKVIGYVCVSVLFLHPLLLVLPKYADTGITPIEAFTTIITTLDSTGIVLGISAWVLMLVLGLLSFFRKKLPLRYSTWRYVHGGLAIVFTIIAAWHVIELGRHADLAFSIFIAGVAIIGGVQLLWKYVLAATQRKGALQQ